MTTDANNIESGDPSNLNSALAMPEAGEDIVSVNKKGSSDNKFAKAIFLLVVGAILVGVLGWVSQNWLNLRKAQLKSTSGQKVAEDTTQVFNPEKTGTMAAKPRLGSDSGFSAPSQAAALSPVQPGAVRDDGTRPLRGADGKVMMNAQGRAMGVDKGGNVIEVPAISALAGDPVGRKPLPGEAAAAAAAGQGHGQVSGQPPPKLPSRYAGSLFVGDPAKPTNVNTPSGMEGANPTTGSAMGQTQAQQIAELLRTAGFGGAQASRTGATVPAPTPAANPFFGQAPGSALGVPPEPARPGTIGSALYSSATPVAMARRTTDQNLILPKGRQADCVLTSRIIDEVPGFTSCVLAQNLYSDNGRVLLLERGSELVGEYGVTSQLGLERLFVTWTRLKTPEGIEIDLSSPGSDRLGTTGIPGHLDNRWSARIGAAFLLSFVKDITVAIINKQAQSSAGSTVSVQTAPGQNMLNASSALAEEVIKQTIKVRPRLTINEGDRISIYVARDLDFSPVYALKTAGTAGVTRLLAR